MSAEGDFFISHFLSSFSGPSAIPCEKEVSGDWSWAGPLLGVWRGPDLPERIGRERIGSQWGKGSSANHKYKFYSRSLSPFVFLGGLRAMSALCMSNSRSAPPGCMMDGSGKAGLGSCQSPLQSLRPHPPQSLRPSSLPTFSLHSAEALSSQFSIHPTSPSPHHSLFDSLTSVPFRCQVSSLEHLLLLSPGQAVSCSDQPGCRRQRLYLVCVWGGVGGAGLAHREPRGQLYEFIHVLLLFPHALE